MSVNHMCPHCGSIQPLNTLRLITAHSWPFPTRALCPGSDQNPRNPESDRRLLWNGKPNPHLLPADDDRNLPEGSE